VISQVTYNDIIILLNGLEILPFKDMTLPCMQRKATKFVLNSYTSSDYFALEEAEYVQCCIMNLPVFADGGGHCAMVRIIFDLAE